LTGDQAKHLHGKLHHGTAGRDGHDDDDEKRLGVLDGLVEINAGNGRPFAQAKRDGQRDDPDAEDHLDFAKKMKNGGGYALAKTARRFVIGAVVFREQGLMANLNSVRHMKDFRREEGVDDGEKKDERGDDVERLGVNPSGEERPERGGVRVPIGLKRRRK